MENSGYHHESFQTGSSVFCSRRCCPFAKSSRSTASSCYWFNTTLFHKDKFPPLLQERRFRAQGSKDKDDCIEACKKKGARRNRAPKPVIYKTLLISTRYDASHSLKTIKQTELDHFLSKHIESLHHVQPWPCGVRCGVMCGQK